jgi:Cu/Ag efflux protein CusF
VRSPLAAASAALLAAACATSSKPAAKPAPIEVTSTGTPGQASAVRSQTLNATVRSVDVAGRSVTLDWQDGGTGTFQVGPQVKQFDDLFAGDAVRIDVEEQLLLELQPPGAASVPYTVTGTGAAAAAPTGVGATGIQVTVAVTKVDVTARLVTFVDPAGASYDVKAGPALRIEALKPGDRLLATYVQAVAVGYEKTTKR